MTANRRAGRPLGDIAEAVLESLAASPKTTKELARKLQCSVPTVKETCRRLRESGRIEVVARIRLNGVNRPVAKLGIVRPIHRPAITALPSSFFVTD